MRIERGITQVHWKTQDGTQVKYRVRVTKKDFKADKLFDDLKAAREFLSLTKSTDGRIAVTEHTERQKAMDQAVQQYLAQPNIEPYLQTYYREYLSDKTTPTKLRSSMAYLARIRTICGTQVRRSTKPLSGFGAFLRDKLPAAHETIEFGRLKPEDIDEQVAVAYIKARLDSKPKAPAKSTVKREVAMLQAFFNKLRFIDKETWKKLPANPFELADKSLLKNAEKKRRRRLSESEEEALFKAISAFKNREMLGLMALALSTGMRRGELLELRWSQVGGNTLQVEDGKTGDRTVILNADAQAVLEALRKAAKDEKVFHYTADGFATNWDRALKRAKISNFRFHDLRREFISRLVELVANPLMIAEMSTLNDVQHIQRNYVEAVEDERAAKEGIRTLTAMRRSVGHGTLRTSSRYYSASESTDTESPPKKRVSVADVIAKAWAEEGPAPDQLEDDSHR